MPMLESDLDAAKFKSPFNNKDKISVLLIDDDIVDLRVLEQLLPEENFKCISSRKISEAKHLLGEATPDCVLLDYIIPGEDSLAFVQELNEIKIPVIMITGQGNEQVAVNAMKFGVYDYLVKDEVNQQRLFKSIEHALNILKLKQKLEQQKEELEQFAVRAAHDLKAPMRHIANYSSLIVQKFADQQDEKVRKYSGYITKNVAFMSKLIDDLLEYARLENMPVAMTRVDLNALLTQLANVLSTYLEENAASLNVGPLPQLVCNHSLMTRLFENLIVNAVKYRHENRAPVISISAQENNRHWKFRVSDNGRGVPPAYRQKVFKPFQTMGGASNEKSVGLGLSMCEKIVKHHDGHIWCEGREEDGADFYFTISNELLDTTKEKNYASEMR